MEEQIVKIIRKVTKNKEITIDTAIDLIENDMIDSLGFIELISELEDNFNIEIQPSQVPSNTWRSVGAIVKMVKDKMEE